MARLLHFSSSTKYSFLQNLPRAFFAGVPWTLPFTTGLAVVFAALFLAAGDFEVVFVAVVFALEADAAGDFRPRAGVTDPLTRPRCLAGGGLDSESESLS